MSGMVVQEFLTCILAKFLLCSLKVRIASITMKICHLHLKLLINKKSLRFGND